MRFLLLLFSFTLLVSCGRDKDLNNNSFNRNIMLTDIADNIIIPAYNKLETDNKELENKINTFTNNPNQNTLSETRSAFVKAYKTWQTVDMFEIGPAKDEKLRLFFNTYPANTTLLENLALSNNYQLELISNSAKQGYPAIDYLLYGFGNSDEEIIAKFSTDSNADKYKNFLKALGTNLANKSTNVKNAWNGYRNTFIENSGSSANASVDLLANAFLLYYEKFYKERKIVAPLGENASSVSPEKLESYYNPELSSELFETATLSMKNFFQGRHYNDNSSEGASFQTYLIGLGRQDLATAITHNFDEIVNTNNEINGTYKDAIVNDRAKFTALYDKIQENLITMKIEMFQYMNITVSYFDGDGD